MINDKAELSGVFTSASMKLLPYGYKAGFTLIEVIVAIMILSVSFVMILQLFSGGLKASRKTCDYTRAIVHAKTIMEELSLAPVQDSGEFEDGYKWESTLEPHREHEGSVHKLMKLKVKIYWPDTTGIEKPFELVSLKTVTDEL